MPDLVVRGILSSNTRVDGAAGGVLRPDRRLQRLGAGKAHMAAVRRRTAASLGTKEMTNLIDLRAISLVAHLSVM